MPVTFEGDRGDPAAIKRFYRNISNAPWQHDPDVFLADPLNACRIDFLLKHLARIAPNTLVDIGCAGGILIKMFKEAHPGSLVYGADLNPIHNVSGEQPGLIAADACALPLRTNSIDCAVCSEMLEHLAEPSFALSEIRRILKSNGFLLITVPNLFCLDSIEGRVHFFEAIGMTLHRSGISSRWRNGINTHIQKLSPKAWADLITSNGFKIIEQNPVYVFPYIPYFLKAAKTAERILFEIPGMPHAQRAIDRALRSMPLGQLHFFLCRVQETQEQEIR